MKNGHIGIFLALILFSSDVVIAGQSKAVNETNNLSQTTAQLAQILAPVALYPDSLLTHILIASTYPLEVVQAQRWLVENNQPTSNQLDELTESSNWDASVIALLPFEHVLTRLSEDLDWTVQLGEAFLADEALVLSSIQILRQKADETGSLAKMKNMDVSYDHENIILTPVEKEIVYVPYYDTRRVYGYWAWYNYPPLYWPTPVGVHVSYYHPYHQPFYWYTGIHLSSRFFFGAFHWHNRHVVVIHHRHRNHYRYPSHYRSNKQIVTSTGAKRWLHQPKHRRGVAYSSSKLNKRYQSKAMNRTTAKSTGAQLQNSYAKKGTTIAKRSEQTRHQTLTAKIKHGSSVNNAGHQQSKANNLKRVNKDYRMGTTQREQAMKTQKQTKKLQGKAHTKHYKSSNSNQVKPAMASKSYSKQYSKKNSTTIKQSTRHVKSNHSKKISKSYK